MLSLLNPLDLRRLPPDRQTELLGQAVQALAPGQAQVVIATRDLRGEMAELEVWPLVEGPSAWFLLMHHAVEAEPVLDEVRRQHRELFRLYKEAVATAVDGDDGAAIGRKFLSLLERHADAEEQRLYPLYERQIGDQRMIRELGYEHLGLRRGMGAVEPFLEEVRAGRTTKRQRDRFEIDFFHLLEHHVEREEKALLPVLERVCPEEAREAARAFCWDE